MRGETMQVTDAEYGAAHSDKSHANYRYHANRMAIATALLKRHVGLQGANVFDFGCGEGSFMRALMAGGATVSGVDPSKSLIDIAPATAAVGSVEVLEAVPAASLDLLVVLNVLGYVPHDEQARFWAAARRAVKLGGYMLQANANPKAAAGREYTFMANPDTFPALWRRMVFMRSGAIFIGFVWGPRKTHWLALAHRSSRTSRHPGGSSRDTVYRLLFDQSQDGIGTSAARR